MATEKTTKKENFQAIVTILEGVNRQDLADVIRHEIELLENKAAKRKPSKSQVANAELTEVSGAEAPDFVEGVHIGFSPRVATAFHLV